MKHKPIQIENFPRGERTDFWRDLFQDAMGQPVKVPFVVARGVRDGPVMGLSAAIHGNELNGIRIIQALLEEIDLSRLAGAVVCAPVANVPSFNAGIRVFPDGLDLNHVFPGKPFGKPAEQYARALSSVFLPPLDYLVDIHTASEGRVNTLYVRADMTVEVTRKMALDFNPEIVLHVKGGDGTLRNAARRRKIPSITVEAGNPAVIQGRMVYEGENGIRNVLLGLEMLEGEPVMMREPVRCRASKWLRTTSGGLLQTFFKLRERVTKGQLLARTRDPFGQIVSSYKATERGIVIGMAVNAAAPSGTRFCHLGFLEQE